MTGGERKPRVFSIRTQAPFLPTLVGALMDGTLLPGFRFKDDPLSLADLRIFVPTRRAGRALRDAFVDALGGRAAILPRVTPIGDVDEAEYLTESTLADEAVLPPNISDLERHVVITKLVWAWSRHVRAELLPTTGGEDLAVPASPSDAARLAADLIRLMDQVATEQADWHRLVDLVPGDYAQYWQISLEFLKIVTEHWPAYLDERGLSDPGVRRNRAIERATERLRGDRSDRPVIAAGSTGTAPATAALLSAVASMPVGAVILPGLDCGLEDDAWSAIGSRDEEDAAPSHPQFGMRQLIARIGIDRADVVELPESAESAHALRIRTVNEALRPAVVTDTWHVSAPNQDPSVMEGAFSGVSLIKGANEEEEALSVAIALREAVAEGETAALVTPDRLLARRVARHLNRWNIRVDDSAGRPLAATAPAILARLVAETALNGFAPVTLLAVLKHPLARLGLPRVQLLRVARDLEIAVLRAPRLAPGSGGLAGALETVRAAVGRGDGFFHAAIHRLEEADWDAVADLTARITDIFEPLEALAAARRPVSIDVLLDAHIRVLNRVVADEDGTLASLADEAAGDRLAAFLIDLQGVQSVDLQINPAQWEPLFTALMSGIAVRPSAPSDPRVAVWGPLEARLQRADRIVLGGLVEGIWPPATRSDPWLSRPMRRDLGLEAPERRIGLAAHDFAQGFGVPRLVLAYSMRKDGAPTVASRWLQRLLAVVGPVVGRQLEDRGDRYARLARDLDGPAGTAVPTLRPEPKPPAEIRPDRLSVTEIETLIRDPYAVYARHVLKLDPLDPIGAMPSLAERGTVLHEIFAAFVRDGGDIGPDGLPDLMDIGAAHFRVFEAFPELYALWWPRFRRIAERYLKWEEGRADGVLRRHAEIRGELVIDLPDRPFKLTGRADRIDELAGGGLAVIDFKTGVAPTRAQISALLAPQLPLEAAIAAAGGFVGIAPGLPVTEIAYVALKDLARSAFWQPRASGDEVDGLTAEAVAQLTRLVAFYRDPGNGYRSRARPMFERRFIGPYDHLARVKEWSLGTEDGE